ncbi:Rab geranylgeranyltransferase BET4 [Ascoidea rubescens DSM 1968]|uniref:Geranylgeranyl transferase type-2 subunit alpha n=1 Tax=Ascoidea rubescens DSM 1968 TaxID=1344418 RepID=A0A1D2VM35_9ASCO|nr:protein prenylyltransferase [Ascoidea rubescens DSM 1968]ODV62615.1 protein prenylyltransferase [Ascoidea rubescens DSM 1968]
MHGIKRERLSEEARRNKKLRDRARIRNYKTLNAMVLVRRDKRDYSEDAFRLSTKLLDLNPEYYTIWNYRREIFLNGLFQDPGDAAKGETAVSNDMIPAILERELKFLIVLLKRFPKCYWIWNHRMWCLENNPKPKLNNELAIVNKILSLDSRNFHGWHYRRYIIGLIESSNGSKSSTNSGINASGTELSLSEFNYTTELINLNFSNFSALHNRSKLIIKIFKKTNLDNQYKEAVLKTNPEFENKLEFLTKELDYFKNAIYTDPDDQSVWLYLRWLLCSNDLLNLSMDDNDNNNDNNNSNNNNNKLKIIKLLLLQIKDINELNDLEKSDDINSLDNKWCLKIIIEIQMTLFDKFIDLLKTNDTNNSDYLTSLITNFNQNLTTLIQIDPLRSNRYLDLQRIYNKRFETL